MGSWVNSYRTGDTRTLDSWKTWGGGVGVLWVWGGIGRVVCWCFCFLVNWCSNIYEDIIIYNFCTKYVSILLSFYLSKIGECADRICLIRTLSIDVWCCIISIAIPIGSIYNIFTHIYHQNHIKSPVYGDWTFFLFSSHGSVVWLELRNKKNEFFKSPRSDWERCPKRWDYPHLQR